jgi:hypothetical protein
LIEGVYRVRDDLLRRVADRHGIHVPSLVADSLVTGEDEQTAIHDAEETAIATLDFAGAAGR